MTNLHQNCNSAFTIEAIIYFKQIILHVMICALLQVMFLRFLPGS